MNLWNWSIYQPGSLFITNSTILIWVDSNKYVSGTAQHWGGDGSLNSSQTFLLLYWMKKLLLLNIKKWQKEDLLYYEDPVNIESEWIWRGTQKSENTPLSHLLRSYSIIKDGWMLHVTSGLGLAPSNFWTNQSELRRQNQVQLCTLCFYL